MPEARTEAEMDGPRRRRRSRRGRDRRSRRSESHRAAEAAEIGRQPHAPVPDHPLVPADGPTLIATPAELDALADRIRAAGSFAYDTEFIGEETYLPRICLVQIATADEVALVDPLARLDPSVLWELVADPDVETIVHAGQQDLEPVVRFLDRTPANVFDTQIAAGFVDRPYPLGLRPLIEDFIGVRLGKHATFTEWDRRPLSDLHLRYAADDVRYLPAIRAAIGKELSARGHAMWASEECASLADVRRYQFDVDSLATRIVGNRSFRPRSLALLRGLLIVRDEAARAQDVPPRTLLKDEILVRIAKSPVRSIEEMGAIKGMPRPVVERYGETLLECTRRIRDLPAAELPPLELPPETTIDRVRIDSLWSIVCSYCHGCSVDPGLVANRRAVARLYFDRRRAGPASETGLTTGWRRELIGATLLDLVDGSAAIQLEWRSDALHAAAIGRPGRTDGPSRGR